MVLGCVAMRISLQTQQYDYLVYVIRKICQNVEQIPLNFPQKKPHTDQRPNLVARRPLSAH